MSEIVYSNKLYIRKKASKAIIDLALDENHLVEFKCAIKDAKSSNSGELMNYNSLEKHGDKENKDKMLFEETIQNKCVIDALKIE